MIAIISCTKQKFPAHQKPARMVYWRSSLFRLSYAVIKKFHPNVPIYIFSAKYGIISETQLIDSYNESFKDMSKAQKEAKRDSIVLPDNEYVFIGGSVYRNMLPVAPTVEYGKGLPIGKKKSYLKSIL